MGVVYKAEDLKPGLCRPQVPAQAGGERIRFLLVSGKPIEEPRDGN